jgi:hypothetical protein
VLYCVFNHQSRTKLIGVISIEDSAPEKTMLFRWLLQVDNPATSSISLREMIIRLWLKIIRVWIPTMLLDATLIILTIYFIYVPRIDIPENWPGLFGCPMEAASLIRFWTVCVRAAPFRRTTADRKAEVPAPLPSKRLQRLCRTLDWFATALCP